MIQLKEINVLNVYPSPATEEITVTFNSDFFANNVVIKVTDMTGRKVFEKEYTVEPIGQFSETLNLRNLESGYYTISISDGIQSKQIRFLKN